MELHFIFWSIASVYISMLTSCLTLQNTANPIQAWPAGSSQISTITTNQMGLRFPRLLYIHSSTKFVIIHSYFHHTFLWFPHSTLILMQCLCDDYEERKIQDRMMFDLLTNLLFSLKTHSHYFQLFSFEDFCFLSTLDNCGLNSVSFLPVCLT